MYNLMNRLDQADREILIKFLGTGFMPHALIDNLPGILQAVREDAIKKWMNS